ncbi:7-cyano-7-deazaguanine synthase QueC [Robiginitomaculum antarcticum]|uniref:7-cyano-7-deazaguanine synthase QueC n=1 Tax=Robiginitomaculum antarcticum TaxID=437507 RepID=UPI0003691B24|nr:7-cyano-7-deazaguanine synthase QueC [Robiginitomaculum antarcticum]
MNETSKALILFSGGQDSATCLAWALERYDHIETVGFDYDQRHTIEMQCRMEVLAAFKSEFAEWADKIGQDHVVDLSALGAISETSLTREQEITLSAEGLPSTFVPGRNLIFLNFAAAIGYRRGIYNLVAGMCEADFSGYPDCRKDTLDAQMQAISLGMDKPYTLETPLMSISKAGAWSLAKDMGGAPLVELIRVRTHSCYRGEHDILHAWGYGCDNCPACDLRAKGWRAYVAK